MITGESSSGFPVREELVLPNLKRWSGSTFTGYKLLVMLTEKVILLTGGADGIGWECARAYAKAGAHVCILDNNPAGREKLSQLSNGNHFFYRTDITQETEVEAAVAAITDRFGKLDAVHNNAGTANPSLPLHNTSAAQWQQVFDLNVKSIYLTTRFAIPHLEKTRGTILNTSSLVAQIGQENHAAYVATKGAVNALTKAMALDYAPMGIRVNAVAPAAVNTPMLRQWGLDQPNSDSIFQYLDQLHPLGKLPDGDVIADACVFLLSDAARFITGCILPVSGGAELGYRR